jgi:3-deoxy-D-manno-octulosonate 8-phosphate phosphatase (KDO 8-P phosphatase)
MPNADAATIRFLVLDVDGVLTDGGIVIDSQGRESKRFNVQDGLGIRLWLKAGHDMAILTGRSSAAVTHRARELGIAHVIQGSNDKALDLDRLLNRVGVSENETAMVGDDLPDLPIMRRVGYAVAVANAVPEICDVARFITRSVGGHGAVREVIEHLLKARDEWAEACRGFLDESGSPTHPKKYDAAESAGSRRTGHKP